MGPAATSTAQRSRGRWPLRGATRLAKASSRAPSAVRRQGDVDLGHRQDLIGLKATYDHLARLTVGKHGASTSIPLLPHA